MTTIAETHCAITIPADQEQAGERARGPRHKPLSFHRQGDCDCRGRRGQLRVGEDQDHLCGWEERLKHMPGPS